MKKTRLIALLMAAAAAFSGCGKVGGDSGDKLQDGDLIVRENESKLNIAVDSFDTFNPIMTKSASVAEFMKVVCEPLFEYDEHANPVAVLAKNYAVSSNGMTVSLEVESVPFHDGTMLSASDVVYTMNMIMENETLYSDSVKYVKEVYADASGRIYIRLTRPVVNFAGMLNFPIVKRGTSAESNSDYIPIGTGAYKYYGKETANQVTFTANAEWHGGETGYKSIIVNILKGENAAVHAFDAGSVDVLASELFKGEELTPRGEYTQNFYTSNALTFLGINNTSKKLAGKSTRKALEILTDREKIVSVEVYSKGTPAKYPINPSAWFYPGDNGEKAGYDDAESLLLKDGWTKHGDGFFRSTDGVDVQLTLKILVNRDNAEKMRIAENIAAGFSGFGIPTSVRAVDFETYKTNVSEKSYELFIGEIITDKSMDPTFLTVSGDNYFGFSSGELDAVLNEMACTADGNVILEKAKRYGEIFGEEMPFVPLFFRKESVVYGKNISGVSVPTSYSIYRDMDKWYTSLTK